MPKSPFESETSDHPEKFTQPQMQEKIPPAIETEHQTSQDMRQKIISYETNLPDLTRQSDIVENRTTHPKYN